MDKTTLSKRKYIYRVYFDAANMVHVVRHCIAYINSKYLYYIPGDKQKLECVEIDSRIVNSLEEYMDWNAANGRDPFSGVSYMYYWSVSNVDPEATKKSLIEKHKKRTQDRKLGAYQTAVRIAEGELAKAQARLAEFKLKEGIVDDDSSAPLLKD